MRNITVAVTVTNNVGTLSNVLPVVKRLKGVLMTAYYQDNAVASTFTYELSFASSMVIGANTAQDVSIGSLLSALPATAGAQGGTTGQSVYIPLDYEMPPFPVTLYQHYFAANGTMAARSYLYFE